MKIIVDTNSGEDAVYESLLKLQDCVVRERLDVGDFVIDCEEKGIICVERKRWSDLASSICDGRFHEQKSRMVQPSTQYVYVIEHATVPSWKGNQGSMQSHCMWAALIKTGIRDGFHVFFASDASNTAALISYIANEFKSGGFVRKETTDAIPGVQKRKRDNLEDPVCVLRGMLSIIPGMSSTKSLSITQAYPTVKDLVGATEADLSGVKCGARRIGPKLAASIKKVFASH